MSKATRIDEFTPESAAYGWLTVHLEENNYQEFKSLPNIVEYEGERFYKMSFNTDTHKACYREAGLRTYHERYAD